MNQKKMTALKRLNTHIEKAEKRLFDLEREKYWAAWARVIEIDAKIERARRQLEQLNAKKCRL